MIISMALMQLRDALGVDDNWRDVDNLHGGHDAGVTMLY